jgi:mRNA-degrading endonuclease RelE of RelBE toxin-antitoxin system
MATESGKPLPVEYTPEFKRNLRQLTKRYHHIRDDIQPIIDQLAAGDKPGDQITGVHAEVFKVRVRNSDAGKGKSGGYRIIYQVKLGESIILITIYSKSEQADVSAGEIRKIIESQPTSLKNEPDQVEPRE